ncbi:MAG: primosomal protein N' [Anaerolineaceae bacterium]|nr:primosomal protein N' [Anaerolineaceae bacterium]
MYAQVAVNVPGVTGVFDYHLPTELEGRVLPGGLVSVPFGRQTVQGIVVRMVEQPQVLETRPVGELLDPEPVLKEYQIRFAGLLAEETCSTLAVCLQLFLPPGLSQQADTLYQLRETPLENGGPLTPLQSAILAKLHERGGLRGRQLEATFPHRNWKEAARKLERLGYLLIQPVLPPPTVRPKRAHMVQLATPQAEAGATRGGLGRGAAGERRQRVLEFLKNEPWPVMTSWVYAASGANFQDLTRLAELGLVSLSEAETWRDPLEQTEWVPHTPPVLTPDQQGAWEVLRSAIQKAASNEPAPPVLVHGVTGSGKTELYLSAIAETISRGKQAIFLVPEISLTPQTVRRVMGRFPGSVGLVHSKLSPGERYDTWRRARAGALPVIVGPRSALFTPLPHLGLIVVDECHDDSYYQGEIQPAYHAVEAAHLYAQQSGALAVFGSATPPVSLMYRAHREHWTVLTLPNRILAHRQAVEHQMNRLGRALPPLPASGGEAATLPLPPVQVVDMREELKRGNRSIFSQPLQNKLSAVLAASQQAILFLNRRGRATYVFCRDCGYVLRCSHCDLPMTLHIEPGGSRNDILVCHTCNATRKMPKTCPQCESRHIRHYGAGTETVEAEVQAMFPQARLLRWDASTTGRKGMHEIILSHFVNHRADILIGTQMLAKGLDLPLVTLVGVVLADVGLNFPDFRAAERTFQLLTQVAGRAGRSLLGGEVIIQTFQPDTYPIQAASQHDYAGFYEKELQKRRQIQYPPFKKLVRFEVRSQKPALAEEGSKKLASRITQWIAEGGYKESASLIGPVPCFFEKVNRQYRWQVILRAPDPLAILRGRELPAGGENIVYSVEVSPPSLL